jgi:hypothetical protein
MFDPAGEFQSGVLPAPLRGAASDPCSPGAALRLPPATLPRPLRGHSQLPSVYDAAVKTRGRQPPAVRVYPWRRVRSRYMLPNESTVIEQPTRGLPTASFILHGAAWRHGEVLAKCEFAW